MNLVFSLQTNVIGFFKLLLSFRCMCPGILQFPKITSLLFLCNILRKNWVTKLIFCMQVGMKTCYKLIVWGWSRIPKVLKIASLQYLYNISKKELKLKLIFCMQSLSKFYLNTLSIKFYYKVENVTTALCSIVMQYIHIFYRDPVMFFVAFFSQIEVISIIEIL